MGMIGDVRARGFKLVHDLRTQGLCVETDYLGKSVKAQMKYANKTGARYTVILGEDELNCGKVRLKCMADGTEQEAALEDIAAVIRPV